MTITSINKDEEYSIKTVKQKFKQQGVYYTPPELCEYLKNCFDNPTQIKEIYDPTCGRGNLLSVFDDHVQKYGQDLNKDEIEIAKQTLKNFQGHSGDTLTNPYFMERKFDYIIANPPFSIKWEPPNKNTTDPRFQHLPALPPRSYADYAFILHCLHLLSDTGQAVIMNFPGILYRQNSEGKIRKWLIENNYVEKVIHIAGNKFTDTSIATCVIVLRKNKQTTDITFINSEDDITRQVPVEEVVENNYNLSINTYCAKPIEKEHIDPVQLEKDIRKTELKHLEKQLLLKRLLERLDPTLPPFLEHTRNIKKLIRQQEKEYKQHVNMPLTAAEQLVLLHTLSKHQATLF